jgi:hypothetical protein
MTYSTLTEFTFTLTCEHAVPPQGQLYIYLPETMMNSNNLRSSGLTLKSSNATTMVFDMGSGYYAEDSITFYVSGIRNARSYAPYN